MATLFVAPSPGYGPAGQCRIYAAIGELAAGARYQDNPSNWREVGLMASDGAVRCIEPEFAALRDDVPLMAGTYYPL